MNVLERFENLVAKLTSTTGRLEKEKYLREVGDDAEVLEILRFLFNPYIVTGISDKKIAKAKKSALPLLSVAGEFSTGVLEYFKKNNTGRDRDVEYLVSFPELVHSIIKRDLKLGVQNTTLNKVFGDGFVPKFDVQLAESYADNADFVTGKDFIVTEKLDGIRCVLIFNESGAPMFFSRSGQAILDLVELTEQVGVLDKSFVYDGELLLDNPKNVPSEDLYRQTVKVTNADQPKRGLFFNLFDMIDAECFRRGIDETPARERKERLAAIIGKINSPTKLRSVPIEYIGADVNEIPKLLKHFCDNGREGIMLNIANAPYECKRGKNILKVKQFYTADVLVTDVEEGTGANRGKLGAVIIEFIGPDKKTYNCRVGSGFKLDEREKYWADKDLIKGKIIEIGYFELSRNQRDDGYSMRFPTFKRPRPDKTEISMF